MTVGIIAEGWSDVAVIQNILKGKLGIDGSDTKPLLPEDQIDETTRHEMAPSQFSNWTLVIDACKSREIHSQFLDYIDDDRFIVVHLDTDMRKEKGYEVDEPAALTDEASHQLLFQNISDKLSGYLGADYSPKTSYAIAIEEIEAWVLTLYSDEKETGNLSNAKEKLDRIINGPTFFSKKDRKKFFMNSSHGQAKSLSDKFRKLKNLTACAQQNHSLAIFLQELSTFEETA